VPQIGQNFIDLPYGNVKLHFLQVLATIGAETNAAGDIGALPASGKACLQFDEIFDRSMCTTLIGFSCHDNAESRIRIMMNTIPVDTGARIRK